MFKKAFIAFSFAAIGAASVMGQTSGDDHKKTEFYVGYSNGQVDTGSDSGNSASDFFRDRQSFNGFNVSGVYNVSRFIGIKGDVSGTYNTHRFSVRIPSPNGGVTVAGENQNSLYNFVGGVQVKDNSNQGKFKPFAHAMAGLGHYRSKPENYTCTGVDCPQFVAPTRTLTDNGFSGIIGGGIDFRVNNRVQVRAIQVDWNPVRSDGLTLNHVRFGAGIVF